MQDKVLETFLKRIDPSVEGCPLVDVKFLPIPGVIQFIFKKPRTIRVLEAV